MSNLPEIVADVVRVPRGEDAIGSRQEWRTHCRKSFRKFQELCKSGSVQNFRMGYVRTLTGFPVGCCVTFDVGGVRYAGASYCGNRDRNRYTKDEARARAIRAARKTYMIGNGLYDLRYIPLSCREKVDWLLHYGDVATCPKPA